MEHDVKVVFDGMTKQITILPNNTNISVKDDLYSAWKNWVIMSDNAKYLPAFRSIGGDPVGPGKYAGDFYFLMNGWRIIVDQPLLIEGNLYHDDGLYPYQILPGGSVISSVSALTQNVEVQVPVVTGDLSSVGQQVTDAVTQTLKTASIENSDEGSLGYILSSVNNSVNDIGVDVTNVLSNLGAATDLINILLKYSKNRTKIDDVQKTMTVFDDDGITPIRVFDLKDLTGAPSITKVAERNPIP